MIRSTLMAFTAILYLAPIVSAQNDAPRFRWQKGQVLTYKVEQSTTIDEVTRDEETNAEKKTQTISKLRLTKQWQVAEVDANGGATLVMSISALRLETVRPGGQPEVFDSAKPDPAHPETNAEMAKYINQPLNTVRLDATGKLLEVKESKFGAASLLEADLPFKITLPNTTLTANQTWERNYTITLDRTGDKHAAVQKYTCKGMNGAVVVVGVSTALKTPPEDVNEQVPLLQFQPEGDVYFHTQSGYYVGSRLKIYRELNNHQGVGSKLSFVSSYAEDFVPAQ